MFKIVCVELNRLFQNWTRYSDVCKGQFNSDYVAADLFQAARLFNVEHAEFNCFEYHKGKSISDSIGSLKCAFVCSMLKSDQGVGDIDILLILQNETKPMTNKLIFYSRKIWIIYEKEAESSRILQSLRNFGST